MNVQIYTFQLCKYDMTATVYKAKYPVSRILGLLVTGEKRKKNFDITKYL